MKKSSPANKQSSFRYLLKTALLAAPFLMAVFLAPHLSKANEAPLAGMANPASTHCLKQGGKLIPKKDKDGGEYALCLLPDNRLIEEWEFYRQSFKEKVELPSSAQDSLESF